jgi:membrane-bound lytic murein transglycosylase B
MKKLPQLSIFLLLFFSVYGLSVSSASAKTKSSKVLEVSKHHKNHDIKAIEKFIQKMSKHIPEQELRNYLYTEYSFNPIVMKKLIAGKREKKNDSKSKKKSKPLFPQYPLYRWLKYNKIFIQPERIELGVKHYYEHKPIYDSVSKQYRIDPMILASILGVETKFGKIQGKYNARNALITNSFHKSSHRQPFYRRELAAFLQLSQQNPFMHNAKGSYAGALGMAQFIPTSYQYYAVDHNKDGFVNLFSSKEDAIASIANYFKEHRWRDDEPAAKLLYEFTHQQINSKNKLIKMRKKLATVGNKARKELKGLKKIVIFKAKKYQLWGLYHNFNVIKRYNSLNSYAMAVHQLSTEIGNKLSKEN